MPDETFCESMVFHPRDDFLAIVDSGRSTLSIVDCRSGQQCQSASVGDTIDGIAFSESGDVIVAVSREHVYTWDLRASATSVQSSSNRVDYDLYTSFPILVAADARVWAFFADRWQLWSLEDLRLLDAMAAPKGEQVVYAGRSPSVSVITYDEPPANHSFPAISIWDVNARVCRSIFEVSGCNSVVVSHDASRMVGAGAGGLNVRGLSGEAKSHIEVIGGVEECEFCCDNRHIVASASDSEMEIGSLIVVDVLLGVKRKLATKMSLRPYFRCSPFTAIVATIANDIRHPVDTTVFWNPLLGTQVGHTSGHVGPSGNALFSPNGRWFATASNVNSAETMRSDGAPGFVALTDLRGSERG